MSPIAILVTLPNVDFTKFVGACREVLGYSPATAANSCRWDLSESEKFLSCLAAIRNQEAPVGIARLCYHIFRVVCLSLRTSGTCSKFWERCTAMPNVSAETTVRGVRAAVVSGTLAQWREVVATASVRETHLSVRTGFTNIHRMFIGAGLNLWKDYSIRDVSDGTRFLEYKPQR